MILLALCTLGLSETARAQLIDISAQVEAAQPSIVGIMKFDHGQSVPARLVGTGFIIDDGRHIVTNAHVVEAKYASKTKTSIFALVPGEGGTKRYRARQIDVADAYDLALLQLGEDAPELPALNIVGDEDLQPSGRAVFSIGFPIAQALGLYPAASSGIISAVTPSQSPQLHSSLLDANFIRAQRFPLYQIDMVAYPGQSGSPLMHAATGQVIGVINATKVKENKEQALKEPSGITYAITAKELRIFLIRNGISP